MAMEKVHDIWDFLDGRARKSSKNVYVIEIKCGDFILCKDEHHNINLLDFFRGKKCRFIKPVLIHLSRHRT